MYLIAGLREVHLHDEHVLPQGAPTADLTKAKKRDARSF